MESYLADHVTRVGAGNGEPLLLIHGLGHCKEAWDPVIGLLGARFDVAAIDLPGFGGAPAQPGSTAFPAGGIGGRPEACFAKITC